MSGFVDRFKAELGPNFKVQYDERTSMYGYWTGAVKMVESGRVEKWFTKEAYEEEGSSGINRFI